MSSVNINTPIVEYTSMNDPGIPYTSSNPIPIQNVGVPPTRILLSMHRLVEAESVFPFIYDIITIWLNNVYDPENNAYFDDVHAYIECDFDNISSRLQDLYSANEASSLINEQKIYALIHEAVNIINHDLHSINNQIKQHILDGYTVDDTHRLGQNTIVLILQPPPAIALYSPYPNKLDVYQIQNTALNALAMVMGLDKYTIIDETGVF
jgi:hypothetical protein